MRQTGETHSSFFEYKWAFFVFYPGCVFGSVRSLAAISGIYLPLTPGVCHFYSIKKKKKKNIFIGKNAKRSRPEGDTWARRKNIKSKRARCTPGFASRSFESPSLAPVPQFDSLVPAGKPGAINFIDLSFVFPRWRSPRWRCCCSSLAGSPGVPLSLCSN